MTCKIFLVAEVQEHFPLELEKFPGINFIDRRVEDIIVKSVGLVN